jgi:hypothetical protein
MTLLGLFSFGLGRLSVESNENLTILECPNTCVTAKVAQIKGATDSNVFQTGQYVASKNGTKYHFPWCSGAQRIKSENMIYFETAEEARRAGYTPASNCKGL